MPLDSAQKVRVFKYFLCDVPDILIVAEGPGASMLQQARLADATPISVPHLFAFLSEERWESQTQTGINCEKA
jgi:hypothetical protein